MKYITTSYSGPDLDGYSCAVAYAELLRAQGKDAVASLWGDPHLEVDWALREFGLTRPPIATIDGTEQVVLLDASHPDDLPDGIRPEQIVEVVDHRLIHRAEAFPNATVQIELLGAAATLVAERFQTAGIVPSKESALLLYGGIISNTQNFSAIDTPRDRAMAAWLKEIAGIADDFVEKMYAAKSDVSGSDLKFALENDTKLLNLGGKRFAIAQLEVRGVRRLIDERREEMEQTLTDLGSKYTVDYVFANIRDLDEGVSYILCIDERVPALLVHTPGVTWKGRLGISTVLTPRKKLSAWIDAHLIAQSK